MVDVGPKSPTRRIAIATGCIEMQAETLALIEAGKNNKGDVLGTARIAGIMAAKKTAELIPLCHPIELSRVEVVLTRSENPIGICCEVRAESVGRTGVEMEAMTAVQISLLTVYDMCKAVDRGMAITDVGLRYKTGGKSGTWCRDEGPDGNVQ